eukprot:EG_transcript_5530
MCPEPLCRPVSLDSLADCVDVAQELLPCKAQCALAEAAKDAVGLHQWSDMDDPFCLLAAAWLTMRAPKFPAVAAVDGLAPAESPTMKASALVQSGIDGLVDGTRLRCNSEAALSSSANPSPATGASPGARPSRPEPPAPLCKPSFWRRLLGEEGGDARCASPSRRRWTQPERWPSPRSSSPTSTWEIVRLKQVRFREDVVEHPAPRTRPRRARAASMPESVGFFCGLTEVL